MSLSHFSSRNNSAKDGRALARSASAARSA
jgi:hypothetical protein